MIRDGSYEIVGATSVQRGTKITMHLKEACKVSAKVSRGAATTAV